MNASVKHRAITTSLNTELLTLVQIKELLTLKQTVNTQKPSQSHT